MTTYFEISGYIVECSTNDSTSHSSSSPMVSAAQRPERGRNLAKNENFSSRTSPSHGESFLEKTARFRRARRAISIALALAAADGPLPIGDAISVLGLGVYAAWEINHAAGDPLQMSDGPYRW